MAQKGTMDMNIRMTTAIELDWKKLNLSDPCPCILGMFISYSIAGLLCSLESQTYKQRNGIL